MRKLLILATTGLALAAAYVAAPLITAWSVREAIRSGDTAHLDATLEWPTVRESLRASLAAYAIGPSSVAAPGQTMLQPGFWQRIKNGLSRRAVDNLVESYVTPEGLPQLFGLRQFYRETVSGEAAAVAALPWHARAAGFWSRIKRAEFHSPTVFEIEMADRNDPRRHYVALMKLRGVRWKVVEIRLKSVEDAALPRASDLAAGAPPPRPHRAPI